MFGLLPVNAHSKEKCLGEIEEQGEVVLRNLDAILQAAGNSPDDVLKMTAFISDITLWGRVNAMYANYFGENRHARTVVPVKELHYGFGIEMDAIAAAGKLPMDG